MSDVNLKIRFQGKEYILAGTLETGGAIATKEQYAKYEESYAHLFPDGRVMRYSQRIGFRDDIEVLGEDTTKCGGNLSKEKLAEEMLSDLFKFGKL
jgi:hypothetical protein